MFYMVDLFWLLLFSLLCPSCKGIDYRFNLENWDNKVDGELNPNVVIGGASFNTFNGSKKIFCWDNCSLDSPISYPSGPDYPRISILVDGPNIKYLNKIDTNAKIETLKIITIAIKDSTNIKDLQLEGGIGWKSEVQQVLIVWSKQKTYLIVNANTFDEKTKDYVTLGRGLRNHSINGDFVNQGRTIYEISSKRVMRLTCVDVKDPKNKVPINFSMAPNYLSNMGGELVTISGPCLLGTIPKDLTMSIFRKQNQKRVTQVSLSIVNQQSSTLQFMSPFLWYPGSYVFAFSYDKTNFETEVEIYSLADSNPVYTVSWANSSEMNNPRFSAPEITLSISELYDSIEFNIIHVMAAMNMEIPSVVTATLPYSTTVRTATLATNAFDIGKAIGYFSISIGSNRKVWSAPFSLVWLQGFRRDNTLIEKNCENFLNENKDTLTSYCPDYSKKAQLLTSTFKRLPIQTDLLISDFNNYECYVQNTVGRTSNGGEFDGNTCCYDNNGSLIYGQDFYLRKHPIAASYGWKYSPIFNKLEHFFKDQIPLMTCCSLISNDDLCSRYWESYNVVRSRSTDPDYIGNVIGDPHILPFNSLSSYSFLSRGEFWLMKGGINNFNLQGRFYSYKPFESILKAIAFSFDSSVVMISTKMNILPQFQWQILINNKSVDLPFTSPGMSILQSGDTNQLSVNLRIFNRYFVHMELSRLNTFRLNEEYLNLKISLSNNINKVVFGGLLGRVETTNASSSLYMADQQESLPWNTSYNDYFNFSKTWQLKSQGESLFWYIPSTNEFAMINEMDRFKDIKNTSAIECNGTTFCNIDKQLYPEGNMSDVTKREYNGRLQYNKEVSEMDFKRKRSCDHPGWSSIILNSSNFEGNSYIKVNRCRNPEMFIDRENQVIRCDISTMTWTPNSTLVGEICHFKMTSVPVTDGPGKNIIMYIVIPMAIVLLLVILVLSVIFYRRRRKGEPHISKSEISVTSHDALHSPTSIPMDDVYDTWQPTQNQPEEQDYAVYTQIKKPPITKR